MQVKYDLYGFVDRNPCIPSFYHISVADLIVNKCATPLRVRADTSLVNYANRLVFVIAGGDPNFHFEADALVDYYNTDTDSWTNAPDLNIARTKHSSCAL